MMQLDSLGAAAGVITQAVFLALGATDDEAREGLQRIKTEVVPRDAHMALSVVRETLEQVRTKESSVTEEKNDVDQPETAG